MTKHTFDAENSLWYKQCGEYRLPCLTGRLDNYLADINRQAEEMFLWLVKQMAEAECVTEQLK